MIARGEIGDVATYANVAAVSGTENQTELDELISAVVGTARHAASPDWGQPPRLYALTKKSRLSFLPQEVLPPEVADAGPDSLIPIEQDALPEGDPAQVLTTIHWPPDVDGCVLVSELVIVPTDAGGEPAPRETEGRLTVGVLRGGQYSCCLQLRGQDNLLIGDDMAQDVVAALLGTF